MVCCLHASYPQNCKHSPYVLLLKKKNVLLPLIYTSIGIAKTIILSYWTVHLIIILCVLYWSRVDSSNMVTDTWHYNSIVYTVPINNSRIKIVSSTSIIRIKGTLRDTIELILRIDIFILKVFFFLKITVIITITVLRFNDVCKVKFLCLDYNSTFKKNYYSIK